MKKKYFEKDLPEGYKQILHLDARQAKFGIIFNAIALLVLVLVVALAFALVKSSGVDLSSLLDYKATIACAVLMISMVIYIVLHELVHGIAYKSLTGEKLTFGMSWSCAFCGVPNIYTYRKTALVALIAPLLIFSVVFLVAMTILFFVSPLYFLVTAFLFGIHLGGCSGDIYVTILFLTRFKDKTILMRDTGPEQFFYVKE